MESVLTTIEYSVTAIVCILSAVVIQRIYLKERKRGSSVKTTAGIKWFGWAIWAWGIGGLINLLLLAVLSFNASDKTVIFWGLAVSLANSLFILLSLPSIEYEGKRGWVVSMVTRFQPREFIGLYAVILTMIGFVFIVSSYSNTAISNHFIWLIDIPISIIVAISLFIELNKAFIARQMKFMLLPTSILFFLILVAVTHRIIPQDQAIAYVDQEFWRLLGSITAISFKFLFILLFSILLYSWKFLSENEMHQSRTQELLDTTEAMTVQLQKAKSAEKEYLATIQQLEDRLQILQEAQQINLSERQKEVLANLAAFGASASYTDVANAMHISVDGFQTHIHQIKKQLQISGAGGKEQLIKFAMTNDYLRFATVSPPK
tara:strand:- start:3487 stop:4614 length:1128 start_codon:yes stop_codon:yes gene_type:complete